MLLHWNIIHFFERIYFMNILCYILTRTQLLRKLKDTIQITNTILGLKLFRFTF